MLPTRPMALASALALALAAVSGCGGDEETADPPPFPGGAVVEDPGPIHVHGLGINPADDALFIATHTGLFRAPEGEMSAERVGNTYQDTMGFTIVGADSFLGSGHPDRRDDLPPFLGLIRSTNGGQSWEPVSLLGKADFHVLEAAGDIVYGYGSDFETGSQRLLVSTDGGESWHERPLPEPPSGELAESLLSLAIAPDDPDHVIASGLQALWSSDDQARHWEFLAGDAGFLAWAADGSLYLIDADGQVKTSGDGGRNWQDTGSIGGEPAALEASGEDLYVALHDGTVKQSIDGGRTWSVRSRP